MAELFYILRRSKYSRYDYIPWCHCKHKHREEPVKDVIFGWLFRYIGLLFSYEYRHTVRHYSVLKHAAIKTYWHFLYDNYILRARARCASAVNLLLSVRTSHDVIASLWLAVCFCLVQSDCVCAAYVMRYQCSLAGPPQICGLFSRTSSTE